MTQGAQPELRIAVVGAGPSGCYTAQALRRALPGAELTALERLPVPYGLVRHGVAPDHQGTKGISRQFARLFDREGVRFVGGIELGKDVRLDDLRAVFDAVVLATGLQTDNALDIPGAHLPGVHGAGRITRLLNAHPLEPRPAPRLGERTAVVGQGNVAMDVVRLLLKRSVDLEGSDIDDAAHQALSSELRVVHVIGRTPPAAAKFDPAMVHEILELPDVVHAVHGVDAPSLAAAGDPRSRLVLDLLEKPNPAATRRVEWWFGYAPSRIDRIEGASKLALRLAGTRAGSHQPETDVDVDSVVTAIGFGPDNCQPLTAVEASARDTGRIEHGLYAAGWVRRGPRGTIASQRADARQLAELIAADLTSPAGKPGIAALRPALSHTTSYEGWLRIDEHETTTAPPNRTRRKLTDLDEMLLIAGAGDR